MKNDIEKLKEAAGKSSIPYSMYVESATKLLSMGLSVDEVLRLMEKKEGNSDAVVC